MDKNFYWHRCCTLSLMWQNGLWRIASAEKGVCVCACLCPMRIGKGVDVEWFYVSYIIIVIMMMTMLIIFGKWNLLLAISLELFRSSGNRTHINSSSKVFHWTRTGGYEFTKGLDVSKHLRRQLASTYDDN